MSGKRRLWRHDISGEYVIGVATGAPEDKTEGEQPKFPTCPYRTSVLLGYRAPPTQPVAAMIKPGADVSSKNS
ncbi:MAG: hypothetical protein ACPGVG_06420, partial [Mycobacterium sp.]